MVQGEEFKDALSFAVVLLIASIPVAIEIVCTTTLALGSRELSDEGAIVSRLAAIEVTLEQHGERTSGPPSLPPSLSLFSPKHLSLSLKHLSSISRASLEHSQPHISTHHVRVTAATGCRRATSPRRRP